ncbi:hypothetical protein [Ruminococcus sp.]|uniref:hypothetical protein n=1 Tax=Ruminococcus sp. TaxID=41978 RepID=UPI0025EB2D4B|nr:hypothetical protein [Ruminococcus sp.]MBQ8964976.1 hypothetical protein [Ruminococcus sp.]
MSKKDRLKARHQKQLQAKRELEEEEQEAREEARRRQSKSAKKLLRKTKYGRYGKEPLGFLFIRLLMLLPFAWSGVYYGLIMIFGTFGGYIDPQPPAWVGWCMLAGDVLVLGGIIVEFFRKHIPAMAVIAVGTGLYLRASQYFIDYLSNRLDEVWVEEDMQNINTEYMKHHYPMGAVAVLELIILIWWIILKVLAAKRAQYQRDTAPVKSIVED